MEEGTAEFLPQGRGIACSDPYIIPMTLAKLNSLQEIKGSTVRKRNVRQFLTRPHGRLEDTDTNVTFSMSRGTAVRLKEIAIAENTSMQDLLTAALDEWLARRGIRDTDRAPAHG